MSYFHSEATPSGVIRTTRTDEAAERQRTVSTGVYVEPPDGSGISHIEPPCDTCVQADPPGDAPCWCAVSGLLDDGPIYASATGYVGDDDHAPPDVDRGGLRVSSVWASDDLGPFLLDDAAVEGLRNIGHYVPPPDGLNPKDAAQLRDRKPPLDLLERSANEAVSWVMKHGADKYGRQNYLTIDIRARIYAAAVIRHAQQFLDGEDTDADSGLSHWAHIGANVHVFLAAEAAGKVIDDRGPAERTPQQDERSETSNHFTADQ